MNKKRVLWLRGEFNKKHGRNPQKAYMRGDELIESEWRRVKKHYKETGEIL